MGKRMIMVLIILLAAGCVQTEILEGPEKIKTITVWDSDLRLHYDRLTDDGRGKDKLQEEGYQEEEREESFEVEEILGGELPQVDWNLIEEGIARDLRDKQLLDERESKRIMEAKKIEEKAQEGEGSAGLKWLIALAGAAFLGGSFTSIKKRERRK
ncbi:hypothetical protein PM10SUCC1_10560 [Propionigenium maris DSM 9537]|uniref:Lipoprotein n=1 Tax=Propionigenium maris DSM 9537 TaxID=1123000 RepID=A0A9W6GL23_9FUSO|nr:hypothetical protein [Propionigenium maris]GLI55542.1 hypothetical protein PM10SUCC1_10560 [Propionigenium maris DSM 9537]